MPPTARLAGSWRVVIAGVDAGAIILSPRKEVIDTGCLLDRAGMRGAATWRGKSDGLDLADAAGHTIAFLSRRTPDCYALVAPDHREMRLMREE